MSILDFKNQYGIIDEDPLKLKKDKNTLLKDSQALPPISNIPKPKIGIQPASIDSGVLGNGKTVNNQPTTGAGVEKGSGFIDGLKDLGGSLGANAGGIANFAIQGYQQLSQEAQTDQEADARTLSLAASGATLGAQVAGPWGAVGGAVIGGAAGMLKKAPDRIKRVKRAYGEYEGKLFDEKNTRDALAEDDERLAELEGAKNLQKAQMGLIDLKY